MSTNDNRSKYHKLNVEPCDPDFTVHVYTLSGLIKHDPTMDALRDMGQHAYLLQVEHDPVAHHYVTDVLDHYTWPVVTITTGAELIAHWEGYRPDMLALIPTLREQCARAAA